MVRNVMHLGLGQVTTTLLTIVLTGTVARTLGPADFGTWILLNSIAVFAYVLVDWGHGTYIVRETARHPERAGDLLGSAMAVRSAAALLVCPVAVATTWLLGYDTTTRFLTAVIILGLLPQYLGLSFSWVFRAYERMDRDAMLNVVFKLTTLVVSMTCLLLGGRLMALVLVAALSGCVPLLMGMLIYRHMRLPRLHASLSTVKELLRGGAPMLAMSLAIAVEPYFNSNILYKTTSREVVGWYGAAWNIAGTLIAPATILGASMYPRLSMTAGDPVEFKRTFDMSFRPLLLLAVLGGVGTYLFADVAMGLIFGLQKFGNAADTLRAFAWVLPLIYVDLFLGGAIVARHKAGRLAGVKVMTVILTTTLCFFLVRFCQEHFGNGGLGVMYALAIGEVPLLVFSGLLLREAVDRRTLGDVLRTGLAGAGTILLFRWLPVLNPFLAIPVCVAVFAGLSLLCGALRRSDVEALLSSVRKKRAPLSPKVESSNPAR
jgi:O-antigen/teichoic acid export membrane protein